MSKFDGILSVKSNDAVKKKSAPANTKSDISKASKRVGKRSDPDYTQITAYIKKNTHEGIMRKIYKRQEFSELIEELLDSWLKKNT